jgi:hypothetical protein
MGAIARLRQGKDGKKVIPFAINDEAIISEAIRHNPENPQLVVKALLLP